MNRTEPVAILTVYALHEVDDMDCGSLQKAAHISSEY